MTKPTASGPIAAAIAMTVIPRSDARGGCDAGWTSRGGQARDREPLDDLADLAGQAAPGPPASSRSRIASMMIRPIARISSGPNPRDVVAGVPMRMPEAVFGGSWSNGMAFLLTVIADLVEQVLGLLAGHPERRHVDEHEVVVRAARDDAGAQAGEGLGHDLGVRDRPPLVVAERLARRPA